jgi:hypothetical protein
MKFGDIDNTVVNFGQSDDNGGGDTQCTCYICSELVIEIKDGVGPVDRKDPVTNLRIRFSAWGRLGLVCLYPIQVKQNKRYEISGSKTFPKSLKIRVKGYKECVNEEGDSSCKAIPRMSPSLDLVQVPITPESRCKLLSSIGIGDEPIKWVCWEGFCWPCRVAPMKVLSSGSCDPPEEWDMGKGWAMRAMVGGCPGTNLKKSIAMLWDLKDDLKTNETEIKGWVDTVATHFAECNIDNPPCVRKYWPIKTSAWTWDAFKHCGTKIYEK